MSNGVSKEYRVQFVSQLNSIVIYFLILVYLAVILFSRSIGWDEKKPYYYFSLAILFLLIQFFAVAETKWKVVKERIDIRWTRQFALHRKKDISIKASDVSDINLRSVGAYVRLIIVLNDGSKFRFWHSVFNTSDDFKSLLNALEDFVPSNDSA